MLSVHNIKGYVSPKPRTMAKGIKRVLKYASPDKKVRPLLIQIKTIGEGEDAVQIREYANGVTFYENKNGLIVLGSNDMELGDIKGKLHNMFPIAATFRKVSKVGGTIQKFKNYLSEITEKRFVKDIYEKNVSVKTAKIQRSSYINACADLQKNRDNMLRVVKNSEY
ncbi:hypothetical protein IKQ21_05460 [bacterium]|nr:hypothetical protein [bacterium]